MPYSNARDGPMLVAALSASHLYLGGVEALRDVPREVIATPEPEQVAVGGDAVVPGP